MTEVAFHFNVPDKLSYSCRLLRKAYCGGARVVVTAEPEVLSRLDQMLWTFSALEFVPHCQSGAPASSVAASPVVLASTLDDCPHHDVLVNLGIGVPSGFERFERFIELVTRADDDRAAARARWKHYADRGYEMKRHDLANTTEKP
ncbi:MAG TPA: DNA polymerase III subunit chi [Polaromonas sp.]|uniref:DNA polymerase III subunit chi n=1 Tax=Polaromonas sp. TaxID=1869339 RepID=UPI002D67E04E|nr:DNA polymerase III subunit chi [Polaromonas sp.]HYW57254.1 DNA polymerase III subunit chi [Polaromonas sp.]